MLATFIYITGTSSWRLVISGRWWNIMSFIRLSKRPREGLYTFKWYDDSAAPDTRTLYTTELIILKNLSIMSLKKKLLLSTIQQLLVVWILYYQYI